MSEKIINNHPEDIDRFQRFGQLAGLEIEDPYKRVEAIKSIDSDQFLELLSVTNGLVRGEEDFSRWTGKAVLSKVTFLGLTDIDPPDDAHKAFSTFYDQLKESINSPEDLEKAAVSTYFAVIGAHMFADGNGRTARTAYELIKYGEVPNKQGIIIDRQKNSVSAGKRLNVATIHTMFENEGYKHGEDFDNIDDLAVDNTVDSKDFFMLPGFDSQLKYIAACRVMVRAGVWEKRGKNRMGIKDWPQVRFEEF